MRKIDYRQLLIKYVANVESVRTFGTPGFPVKTREMFTHDLGELSLSDFEADELDRICYEVMELWKKPRCA